MIIEIVCRNGERFAGEIEEKTVGEYIEKIRTTERAYAILLGDAFIALDYVGIIRKFSD